MDFEYSVFYGTNEFNKLSYQQQHTYDEAVGDKWKNQEYMGSMFDALYQAQLELLCVHFDHVRQSM
ncbi:MAG: hypothetical protein L0I88_04785 [Alkalibacterium sp.]|nr:hypothetical protein [Alkalibacterium sp.]